MHAYACACRVCLHILARLFCSACGVGEGGRARQFTRACLCAVQPKDIKMLLGEGAFTKDTLRNLLAHNELGNYDPVKEAFKAYDPNGESGPRAALHPISYRCTCQTELT